MPKQSKHTDARIVYYTMSLLGKQIRISRMERKMTARELADRTGISQCQRQPMISVHNIGPTIWLLRRC